MTVESEENVQKNDGRKIPGACVPYNETTMMGVRALQQMMVQKQSLRARMSLENYTYI